MYEPIPIGIDNNPKGKTEKGLYRPEEIIQ